MSTMLTVPYALWWKRGFRDLVSVVPPGAPLSNRTKLRLEDRGKVPGLHGRHGWYGFDWMKHETTAEDAATWEGHGANLGLRATRFPAIDIDVTDREIRDFIQGLADRHLGPAPARTGRAPKLLLVYRLADDQAPMTRRRLWFKGPDGRDHLVEVLGHGQQYVVEGMHPVTRKPYTWDAHPAERDAIALSPITLAQVDDFMVEMRYLLETMGGCTDLRWEGSGDAVTDREAIVQEDLQAPSLDALAAAVATIPNDNERFPSRTDYLRMGCAIKAAGADDPDRALEVWEEWACRWEGNATIAGNDPIEVVSDWERMKAPFEVGWGYVRDVAQECGFAVAATEFDELPAEDLTDLLPKAPSDTFPALSLADCLASQLRPVRWRIEGWLPESGLVVIFGPSNAFKSFIAIDMALCVANGIPWHGHRVAQGPVLYLALEGGDGVVRQRVPGWHRHHNRLDADPPFRVITVPVTLSKAADAEKLQRTANACFGKPPVVICVDVLKRSMTGTDSSDEDVAPLLDTVRRVFPSTCVLFITHTGWGDSNRSRGSTDLWGSFDTRLKANGEAAARRVTLEVERHKDAESGAKVAFKLETIETGLADEGGNPIGTLVPLCDLHGEFDDTGSELSPREQEALEALQALIGTDKDTVQASGGGRAVKREAWRHKAYARFGDALAESSRAKTFDRAAKRLESAGYDRAPGCGV
ncbi:AAA family ATPase [Azospirillum agricola]|uniref:AAA family ATPase n=1 Tax=Azospirillum agricola TaxID=1720247 RepID=UPI0015C45943|nr:AAA family ATPase [Azospirillum agricola]